MSRLRILGAVITAAALAASLGGCTDLKRAIGMEKSVPDEFAVVSRVPLAIPPDYSLRPPQPGAAPSQEVPAQSRAREAVFRAGPSQSTLPPAANERSAGEGALLREAGAPNTEAGIRERVSEDAELTPENEKTLVDKLLFWRASTPADKTVDPAAEAKRIKDAQASGKPVAPDAPGGLPTVERKKSTSIFSVF